MGDHHSKPTSGSDQEGKTASKMHYQMVLNSKSPFNQLHSPLSCNRETEYTLHGANATLLQVVRANVHVRSGKPPAPERVVQEFG